MTQFEYLSVLVSIILALGMSEVMISWARMIQRRDHVKFSLLHAFWTVFILFLMIQFWWGFWNSRLVDNWSLSLLLGVVIECTILVVIAILFTPDLSNRDEIDLEQVYFSNAKPFFLLASVMLVILSVTDSYLLNLSLFNAESVVRYIGAGAVLVVAFSDNRKVHYCFPFVGIALMAAFLINVIVI